MSVLPEFFDPFLFHRPNQEYHFTIKRPYTTFAKTINIEFNEYNANLKVQCMVFDRIWGTCKNIYGIGEAKRYRGCFEALNYFNQCVKINKHIAIQKKYAGHLFAGSRYQHLTPTHEQIID